MESVMIPFNKKQKKTKTPLEKLIQKEASRFVDAKWDPRKLKKSKIKDAIIAEYGRRHQAVPSKTPLAD